MKRDLDLVRQLLLQIEGLPAGPPAQYRMSEIEDPVLLAHFELVIASGLVNGKISRSQSSRGDVISISGLTWEGHEWIEMVRRQSVWNETKSMLLDRGGALTYELTKAAASRILRARLEVAEGGADAPTETALAKRERAGWDSNPRDP
jgi:hypothetical protein